MAGVLIILIAIFASCFPEQSRSENPNAPVITIKRTGGYAGVDNQIYIFADGKVIEETGKVRHVQPATLERFIRSMEKVGTMAPDKAAGFERYCFDCFLYTVNISRGDAINMFILKEPIPSSSKKEVNDAQTIRDFLSVIFSPSYQK
ncbi:MAG: hypothetical protein JXA73_24930 [Acidobacteria bacterium]|nr:hypothetical protein [Acidobacteriota bacterium]